MQSNDHQREEENKFSKKLPPVRIEPEISV